MSFWDGCGLCEKLCGINPTRGVEGCDLGGHSIKSGNWRVGIESPPGPNNLVNKPDLFPIDLIIVLLIIPYLIPAYFLHFRSLCRKTLKPLACPCSAPSSIFPNSLCSLGLAEYLPYSGLLFSGEEQEQDFEDGAED